MAVVGRAILRCQAFARGCCTLFAAAPGSSLLPSAPLRWAGTTEERFFVAQIEEYPMTRMHRLSCALVCAAIVWLPRPAQAQSMADDRYVLPPESVQELFRRDKNLATLDRLSPDGDHFLIPQFQELTNLKLMSRRTLRLAMLEFVPEVNREWRQATYGNVGLQLFSLKERRTYPIKMPADSFASDMRWSPDGTRLAFIAHLPTASQVWVADVRTGEARAVSDAP
jgi:hypothetical protein